jgi:putative transposase
MGGKRHSQDEISTKLNQVHTLTAQGKSLNEALKSIGVSRQTLYRWRQEHEHAVDQPSPEQRLRELEAQNEKLRKAVTDLILEKMAMAEARARR